MIIRYFRLEAILKFKIKIGSLKKHIYIYKKIPKYKRYILLGYELPYDQYFRFY